MQRSSVQMVEHVPSTLAPIHIEGHAFQGGGEGAVPVVVVEEDIKSGDAAQGAFAACGTQLYPACTSQVGVVAQQNLNVTQSQEQTYI
jgi:hypothetical protein